MPARVLLAHIDTWGIACESTRFADATMFAPGPVMYGRVAREVGGDPERERYIQIER
jgi:hypothetical protein